MWGAVAVGGLVAARHLHRKKRHLELSGRVILITGATRGLGLVMARQLSQAGAKVAICGRNQEELDAACRQLSELTSEFLGINCNVTDKVQVQEMMSHIQRHWGEVEVLINNAGIIQVGPMEHMNEEDYRQAINVHFWAPFNLIKEALPGMKASGQGRIVNIASINGKVSFPHLLPYTVSKFALAGFSEGITSELGRNNIRVTSVYPGLMRTGSPRNIDVKGRHKKEYAWFKVSDSLPGLSMDAEKAAAKIIKAMKYGKKVIGLGLPAKLAMAMEGLVPGINLSFFDVADKLLPGTVDSHADSADTHKGYESESDITKSMLTSKTTDAEKRNNERLKKRQ
nr:SDR family oxidoreductase [Zobellia alginiliquefaciens]